MVKWKGYPDPTPEALWKILRDTNNPEVLAEIDKCKEDYLSDHPAERTMRESEAEAVPEVQPTRVQPGRTRTATERFTFMVHGVNDSMLASSVIASGLRNLRKESERRSLAARQFVPDFSAIRVS